MYLDWRLPCACVYACVGGSVGVDTHTKTMIIVARISNSKTLIFNVVRHLLYRMLHWCWLFTTKNIQQLKCTPDTTYKPPKISITKCSFPPQTCIGHRWHIRCCSSTAHVDINHLPNSVGLSSNENRWCQRVCSIHNWIFGLCTWTSIPFLHFR